MAASTVAVSVRIKPSGDHQSVLPDAANGVVFVKDDKHGSQGYATLDGFGDVVTGSDQADAYERIAAPLVDQLLEGYSCTLMAYGQTGSGKTHTIFGPPGVLAEAALRGEMDGSGGACTAPVEWGLFPRIALELLAMGKGTLHASAVEVYQERAYDLLADRSVLTVGAQKTGRQQAAGSKDPNAAVPHKSTCTCRECYKQKEAEKKARAEGKVLPRTKTVARSFSEMSGAKANKQADDQSFATVGEKRVLLSDAADVARLARTIEQTRTAVGHLLNARSSRSHCLVHLHLTEANGGGGVTRRQLLVVDLAGSERILRSGAEGVAAAQAMAINTSLTALGKVVRALGAKQTHVPYRDSTLTQLLRSSLAGRSSTAVVIAVASDDCFTDESRVSLEFGQRMQAVTNRATIERATASTRDEKADAARSLDAARRELASFEASGYGAKFGKNAQPGEVKAFKENEARLADFEREAFSFKTELAEIKMLAAGGDHSRQSEAREISSALRDTAAEVANLQGMLARQKAIAGFYIPARAVYTKKAAEVRALENRLEVLEQLEHSGSNGTSSGVAASGSASGAAKEDVMRAEPAAAVTSRSEASPPQRAHRGARAADEWEAHKHEETGQFYFFNRRTNESTWDPPPGYLEGGAANIS